MKRILPLIVLFMMALGAQAQQFKWKEVTPSMTTVPEDFYEGTTKVDAQNLLDNDLMAEGAIYGAISDGLFHVLHWDNDWENIIDEQLSWDGILDSGLMYSYPAKVGDKSAELEIDENTSDNINDLFDDMDTYSKVTILRHMSRFLEDGTTKRWHTVALPFSMTAEQIAANFGANAQVMVLKEIDENTFKFETASSIVYGDFCLVQLGDLDEDVTKIEVSGDVYMSTLYSKYDFDYTVVPVTSYSYVDNMLSACYVVSNNALQYVSDEAELGATQWYVTSYEDADTHPQITVDGVATAISSLQLCQNGSSRKFVRNSQIAIQSGNKVYNAAGLRLK